ncbi:hypothetical protein WT98_08940 [Burkholderia territorii]|nr:hypothetical protein WT98_08940 [Burkholderia territorii]
MERLNDVHLEHSVCQKQNCWFVTEITTYPVQQLESGHAWQLPIKHCQINLVFLKKTYCAFCSIYDMQFMCRLMHGFFDSRSLHWIIFYQKDIHDFSLSVDLAPRRTGALKARE